MASTLYQSIIEKGEARGKAEGKAETIMRILALRMGSLDPAIQERIRRCSDIDILAPWYDEALLVIDAEDARRLADKILKASS